MCNFFSLISDGNGKVYYFDSKLRKDKKLMLNFNPDSHTSIATYFGFKDKQEDKMNKYEYNPITCVFVKDQINTKDDSKQVEEFCRQLDFKTIIPELNIKTIVNALHIVRKKNTPSKKEIQLLKECHCVWARVGASVGASVRASFGDSVGDSVWASVGASVGDSVWASVGASVRASFGASVRASFGDSVWDRIGANFRASVWASVCSQIGTMFIIQEWKYVKVIDGKYPFQCYVDLWNAGLVPSFDGTTWRLHAGKEAKIVYEWNPKKE